MSGPSVLVNFRLDPASPVRLHWTASDGTPTDGYKAQVIAVRVVAGDDPDNRARIPMDASAILEQVVSDPLGGPNDFLLTFTGMVGFPSDHPDRAKIDALPSGDESAPIEYELVFVHAETGRHAGEGADYTISVRPQATAHKLSK